MFKMCHTRGHWGDVWVANVALPLHCRAVRSCPPLCLGGKGRNQAEIKLKAKLPLLSPAQAVHQDLCRVGMLQAQTIPEQEDRNREPSQGQWRGLDSAAVLGQAVSLLCHSEGLQCQPSLTKQPWKSKQVPRLCSEYSPFCTLANECSLILTYSRADSCLDNNKYSSW